MQYKPIFDHATSVKLQTSPTDVSYIINRGSKKRFLKVLYPHHICPSNPIEIDIQSRIRCQGILRIESINERDETTNGMSIEFEVLEQPLYKYIQERNPSTTQRLSILFKIIRLVDVLHSLRILHLDIRPENIMMDKNEEPYMIDFGFAKVTDDITTECYIQHPPMSDKHMAPEIRSPEIYVSTNNPTRYGWYCDIWSIACLMSFVLFNSRLYPPTVTPGITSEIFEHLKGVFSVPNYRISYIESMMTLRRDINVQIKEILLKILNYDYMNRPTASEILNYSVWDQFRQDSSVKVEMVITPRITYIQNDIVKHIRSICDFYKTLKSSAPIQSMFLSVDLYYRSNIIIIRTGGASTDLCIACIIIALLSTVYAETDKFDDLFIYYGYKGRQSNLSAVIENVITTLSGVISPETLYSAARNVEHLRYMMLNYFFDPQRYMNFDYRYESCNHEMFPNIQSKLYTVASMFK